MMIDPKKIEQLARQVHESMPKGVREFGDDVEKKIRQVLQAQHGDPAEQDGQQQDRPQGQEQQFGSKTQVREHVVYP